MKNKMSLKKQVKALKELEDKVCINIEPKANNSLIAGAICLTCGVVGNYAYSNVIASCLMLAGVVCLGNSIIKSKKFVDKNIYNNAYKYHRYDMFESMNNYVTLYNLQQDLQNKKVQLSCQEIEQYIREIVHNNYLFLRNEKSKSYVRKAKKNLRLEYANKSILNEK